MKTKYSSLLPYIIILLFSAILINNMFYGFSWTDEGLYLSNVQRYLSGDRFLIDDWTPTQFYEPLLYPLYALFIKATGSTDGVFLFFRIATIIFQTLTAFFAYTLLSKKYSAFSACSASLIVLSFARACINGPSYYTIGFESYLIALLCLYAFFSLSYSKFFFFFRESSLLHQFFAILSSYFPISPFQFLHLFFQSAETTSGKSQLSGLEQCFLESSTCFLFLQAIHCLIFFRGCTTPTMIRHTSTPSFLR